MTKDVLLSITGLYAEDNENKDRIETLIPAQFYQKEDAYYVFYEEILDDSIGVTKSRMKISEKCVELNRRGDVNVTLTFTEGEKSVSAYQLPYGVFTMGIDTHVVKITETEETIDILIQYTMEMDGQIISENDIEIVIKSITK